MSKVTITLTGETLPLLEVDGQPIPAERVRRGRGGRFYVPKRTRDYRAKVSEAAMEAWGDNPPLTEEVGMVSVFKRKGKQACDADNLQKTMQDALLGIAYLDDSQIHAIVAVKEPESDTPGSQVLLMALENLSIKVEEPNDRRKRKKARKS